MVPPSLKVRKQADVERYETTTAQISKVLALVCSGMGHVFQGQALKGALWALGFLFCGFYTGNAEHTSFIVSFSFLPWIIWRLDVALSEHNLWPAIEAGSLWGLSALSGYPAFTVITGMYAAMWVLGRAITRRSAGRLSANSNSIEPGWLFTAAGTAAFAIAGALVMSPIYFSFFYEGPGFIDRVNPVSREIAITANSLHPGAVATFASPYLILLKLSDFKAIWSYTDVSSCSIYLGGVITVLAIFGLVMRPRSGWRWWLGLIAALALASAMGTALPLRGWLNDLIYPMRFLRHASVFRAYYLFTLCVLALSATRYLSEGAIQNKNRWRLLASALVLTLLAVLAIVLVHRLMPIEMQRISMFEYLHLLVIWGGICLLAFIGARWPLRVHRYIPIAFVVLALTDVAANTAASAPLRMATDVGFMEYQRTLDRNHRTELNLQNGLKREMSSMTPSGQYLNNDNLFTKTPVFRNYASRANGFYSAITDNQSLTAMATGDERIWFSTTAGRARPTVECLAAFEQRTKELGGPPLLIQSGEEVVSQASADQSSSDRTPWTELMSGLTAGQRIHAEVIKYDPETLIADVDAPAAGWLVVTDRWARSWKATVNEKATPVYCGDFIFRAVPVSAGHNRIAFRYGPRAMPGLVLISWAFMMLTLAGSYVFRRRAKRAARTVMA